MFLLEYFLFFNNLFGKDLAMDSGLTTDKLEGDDGEATVKGRKCLMCDKIITKNKEWYCPRCKIKKNKIRLSGIERGSISAPVDIFVPKAT